MLTHDVINVSILNVMTAVLKDF